MIPEDKSKRYEILELLAKIAGYKGVSYEVAEIKDGRIHKIKNLKIDEVDLTCPLQ